MPTLDEFQANFNRYSGPAFLNRFDCLIISPFEANPDFSIDRFVSYRVVSLTFPGKNIRTVTNETVYGPTYELAQGLTYAESVSMTFHLSAEHRERQYFLNWIDFIYKPDTYNLEYYDNYNRSIELYQLNKSDKRISGMKLLNCYPKTIGPVEYAQDAGEVATLSVEFAFKEHYLLDAQGNELSRADIPQVNNLDRVNSRRRTPLSPFGALDYDF